MPRDLANDGTISVGGRITLSSTRHAVLIGCNRYANLPALRCPRNDVQAMERTLLDPTIGHFDSVIKLPESMANADMVTALEELITGTAKIDDTIIVYFSGHGKLDQLGRLYLSTRGTKEAVLDATSIAIERVIGYVDRSACQTVLLILDCCYSGAIRGVFRKGGVDGALTGAAQGRGLHIMTSSTDIQQSHEKEGETNSVFTKFLIEGLSTGQADLDNDGVITADEAYSYTERLVKGTGLQNPMKFNLNVAGQIILAKNCNYQPLEKPNPNTLSEEDFARFFAVKNMIDLLQTPSPPVFMVLLFTYYIEGELYHASGLTVSPHHTPNIRQTQTGFECDTIFTPDMITPNGRRGKEVLNGRIKVRMRVDLKDIRMIIGALEEGKGRQVQLYPGGKREGELTSGDKGSLL